MSTALAYRAVTPTPFAQAAVVHTFMNAIAGTAHGQSLTEFEVSFDGVTTTAVPCLIELCTSTQAGAGTSGVSMTVTQVRGRATGGTPLVTGGSNYTAEPTVLVNISRWYLPQFMGSFTYQFPLGREVECDASGGTIKGLCVRTTPSAAVNLVGSMELENL